MNVLVTGTKGMIGSQLVKGLIDAGHTVIGIDRTADGCGGDKYQHYECDLADRDKLKKIVNSCNPDRIIHLAALAHTKDETDLSWERYKLANVDCSKNVFCVAGEKPVLYISTIDVYGFYDGKKPLNSSSEIHPVSNYGISKALAEKECRKLPAYSIFRLSPVYTDDVKRDIQKRYYLKYPSVAYQIGKGSQYEILNIKKAVKAMIDWCEEKIANDIRIIKDDKPMWTPEVIEKEKKAGRARIVLKFPRWMVNIGYVVLKTIFGENEKIYLLNKAVHPLITETE